MAVGTGQWRGFFFFAIRGLFLLITGRDEEVEAEVSIDAGLICISMARGRPSMASPVALECRRGFLFVVVVVVVVVVVLFSCRRSVT